MSIASTIEHHDAASSNIFTTLGALMQRLCAAYIAWRLQSAVIFLQAMSDEQLSDIGLARSDLTSSVQGATSRPGRRCAVQ
jgi:uncharacterized protein YjiS (DUF1127 family)